MNKNRLGCQFIVVSFVVCFVFSMFPTVCATIQFQDAFESGDFSAWTASSASTGCSITASTVEYFSAGYSAKSVVNAAVGTRAIAYKAITGTNNYFRVYHKIDSLSVGDTSNMLAFGLDSNNYRTGTFVRRTDSGYYVGFSWSNGTWVENTSSATLDNPLGWHCYEVHFNSSAAEIWVDGALQTEISRYGSGLGIPTNLWTVAQVGCNYNNGIADSMYVDNVVIADSYIGMLDGVTFDPIGQTTTDRYYETTLFSECSTWGGASTLSGYIFSVNNGSGYANETWSAFAQTNNSWANLTRVNLGAVGQVVSWFLYVNNSYGAWYMSGIQTYVLTVNVTFFHNEGGSFFVQGASLDNGTLTVFDSPDDVQLLGAPNSGNTWQNFTWTGGGEATTNPYSYSLNYTASVWCFFSEGSGGVAPTVDTSEYTADPLMLACVFVVVVGLVVVLSLLLVTTGLRG